MCDQEFNIKFVKEVETHRELYNYELPEYTRKEVTDRAWQEVGTKMNMPAAECKIKWRNLRTVFLRHMKLASSTPGGRKKAYYLKNAMQFCVPFMRTSAPPPSGDSPSVPFNSCDDEIVKNEKVVEKEEACEDSTSEMDFLYPVLSLKASPPSPHQANEPPVQSSVLPTQSKRKLSVENQSTNEDNCVAEYSDVKKARVGVNVTEGSSQRIDRQKSLKMFLLSLIPELEELSDAQIKLFKRRVFKTIDEILISK